GVREQVAQHLAEGLAISLDGKPFSNLQMDGVLLPLQWLKLFENLVHKVDHDQLLCLGRSQMRVCPPGLQNGVDEHQQGFASVCRLVDVLHPLLTCESVVKGSQ